MPPRLNLIGQRFGRLEVVQSLGSDHTGKSLWLCKCDCGGEIKTIAARLTTGATASCGCLKRDVLIARNRKYSEEEAPYRVRYNRYRFNAEARGYEFSISFEYWFALTQSDCFWCGAPPQVQGSGYYKTVSNGVDRYNNDLGYTEDNCVASCYICNRAKSDLPLDQWLSWLDRIRSNG